MSVLLIDMLFLLLNIAAILGVIYFVLWWAKKKPR